MRDEVEARRPDLAAALDDAVGGDGFERLDEGTHLVQPAIFCASVAAWDALRDAGVEPRFAAGHSLGELAALVAAAALDAHEGLRLVVERGRLMHEACDPEQAMLALVGPGAAEAARPIAAAAGAFVANDNAPGQAVVAGHRPALEAVRTTAAEHGLRAVALPVHGAFHTPAMASAAEGFARLLAGAELRPPRMVVVSGATGRPFTDVRRELADGLLGPVLWRAAVAELRAAGVRRWIECGPGQVLSALVRRMAPGDEVLHWTAVPVPAEATA